MAIPKEVIDKFKFGKGYFLIAGDYNMLRPDSRDALFERDGGVTIQGEYRSSDGLFFYIIDFEGRKKATLRIFGEDHQPIYEFEDENGTKVALLEENISLVEDGKLTDFGMDPFYKQILQRSDAFSYLYPQYPTPIKK